MRGGKIGRCEDKNIRKVLENDLSKKVSGSPLFFWLWSHSFLFLHLFQFGFVSPVWLCKALCASPFMYPYWCTLILLNFAVYCLILSTPSLAFLICDVVASYQRKHCQWFMQVHSYVEFKSDTILCSVQRFWWGVCYSWMIVLCVLGFYPFMTYFPAVWMVQSNTGPMRPNWSRTL